MDSTQLKNHSIEEMHEQQLGDGWIQAITNRTLDRLADFCHPMITGRLLIPPGLVTITNAADLIAEYRGWFGECSDFRVEASRVARVGEKLGIGYRFVLQDHGDWYQIEQQLFCALRDGRVQQLYLL